jgi:hypothetical protein
MSPLFDKNTDLVGWLSDNSKHIFDTDMDWVAFIADDSSIWNVNSFSWMGHLYGKNIRDFDGKTLYWNPETPIQNTAKPFEPFRPFKPFAPFRPFRPFTPFRPFEPFEPMGGWSSLTWNDFVDG